MYIATSEEQAQNIYINLRKKKTIRILVREKFNEDLSLVVGCIDFIGSLR